MNPTANNIKQRLSLRKPLQESLDIVAQLADTLTLEKEADLAAELETVKALYPTCTDFERAFPSLCFSIATGVGKTRLMGAFVAYLYLQKGIRNFFILAPNLTIYNKLIEDFGNTANPKYVFNGLAEFVHNKPVIITGDNYAQQGALFSDTDVRINIFNVSKFNADSRGSSRGAEKGKPPRIKRLSEYLGQSYWSYLSGLQDLVMLMDEAHRYHADASKDAINELRPVLGLELTATPIDETGKPFRNVVYEYSLAQALADGLYVKNPTIAKRKDFDPKGRGEEEIERIKLEDAISLHLDTKKELELYALNAGRKLVKPFVLVVCQNTTHAKAVFDYLNTPEFFGGAYAGKVLQIDSTTRNTEQVEATFLTLENPDNEIEIVIHVNMLKEGWDVTNLYTIVPLRAANAAVLVEQTIGRGLRLPYDGSRTGVDKVDKLTVVAHDNFDRIIAASQDPNSVLNKLRYVELSDEDLVGKAEVVTATNNMTKSLADEQVKVDAVQAPEAKQKAQTALDAKRLLVQVLPAFNNHAAVKKFDDLAKPEVKAEVLEAVKQVVYSQPQQNLFAQNLVQEAEAVYATLVADYKKNIIEIPRMDLVQGEVTASFDDFELGTQGLRFQPLDEEIVVIGLKDGSYDTVGVKPGIGYGHPVKQIISELINYSEIDYDDNAALLHKLTGQAIAAIEAGLEEGKSLAKTVWQFRKLIAARIYEQMMQHFRLHEGDYGRPDVKPFIEIKPWNFKVYAGTKDYRDESFPARDVPKYVFAGFEKAGHAQYMFDSRTEQTFAYVLENDKKVLKWLRPAKDQLRLYWHHNSQLYLPDFIAETVTGIYMIETKAAGETAMIDVQEKAKAALKYCRYASEFTAQHGGKPWRYALVPHDAVHKGNSFEGMVLPYVMAEN